MKLQALVEYDRLFIIDSLKSSLSVYKESFEREKSLYDRDVENYKSFPFWRKLFIRNPEKPENMFSPSAMWERAGDLMHWIVFLEREIGLLEKSEAKTVIIASNSWIADFLEN